MDRAELHTRLEDLVRKRAKVLNHRKESNDAYKAQLEEIDKALDQVLARLDNEGKELPLFDDDKQATGVDAKGKKR